MSTKPTLIANSQLHSTNSQPHFLRKFKSYLRRVRGLRWGEIRLQIMLKVFRWPVISQKQIVIITIIIMIIMIIIFNSSLKIESTAHLFMTLMWCVAFSVSVWKLLLKTLVGWNPAEVSCNFIRRNRSNVFSLNGKVYSERIPTNLP